MKSENTTITDGAYQPYRLEIDGHGAVYVTMSPDGTRAGIHPWGNGQEDAIVTERGVPWHVEARLTRGEDGAWSVDQYPNGWRLRRQDTYDYKKQDPSIPQYKRITTLVMDAFTAWMAGGTAPDDMRPYQIWCLNSEMTGYRGQIAKLQAQLQEMENKLQDASVLLAQLRGEK